MVRIAILGAHTPACTALRDGIAQHCPALAVAAAGPNLPALPADLTLLCALDLPDAHELQLRDALAQAGTAYQVLYGPPAAQLRNALNAIDLIATRAYPSNVEAELESKPSHPRLRAWVAKNAWSPSASTGCSPRCAAWVQEHEADASRSLKRDRLQRRGAQAGSRKPLRAAAWITACATARAAACADR